MGSVRERRRGRGAQRVAQVKQDVSRAYMPSSSFSSNGGVTRTVVSSRKRTILRRFPSRVTPSSPRGWCNSCGMYIFISRRLVLTLGRFL